MAGKRKPYTPEFKFKVVLESLQRDTTMEEVCRKYSVSSSMVSRWRLAFQQKGSEIFRDQRDPTSRSKAQGYGPGESPDDLKKLIGELTVQNNILKKIPRTVGEMSKHYKVELARTLVVEFSSLDRFPLVAIAPLRPQEQAERKETDRGGRTLVR